MKYLVAFLCSMLAMVTTVVAYDSPTQTTTKTITSGVSTVSISSATTLAHGKASPSFHRQLNRKANRN